MTPWRILADDLTGALDTAAAWAGRAGIPVFLDTPADSTSPVQVVATGTRDVPLGQLPDRLAPCLDWFTASGHAFKKVDSLLRGNTFDEVAWLVRSGRFRGCVFAPAFPAQGRFTARGRHWVAPPHQPDGPRTHEHAETLPDAFARLGLSSIALDQPARCLEHPGQVVVPDVRSDADLATLAALATRADACGWLWCGSAGLGWALARQDAPPTMAAPDLACGSQRAADSSPVLLVTASRHPVLRGQMRYLAQHAGLHTLLDLTEPDTLAPAEAADRLASRAATLVSTHARPSTLVVVGGDTLLALCRASGVRALRAGVGPRPGWGSARFVGGRWDGTLCLARSGAFGAADDLHALLQPLTPSTESPP